MKQQNTMSDAFNVKEDDDAIPVSEKLLCDSNAVEESKLNGETIDMSNERIQGMIYNVNESPPLHLTLLFALQQSVMSIPNCTFIVAILADVICATDIDSIKAKMFATTVFLSGLTTFFQNVVGVRLPVYQGPVSQYIISLMALSAMPEWQCPDMPLHRQGNDSNSDNISDSLILQNYTNTFVIPKIQIFQGSLVLAGVIHMLIGVTGVLGIILRFVGPLTIVPTLLLVGIKFSYVLGKFCEPSWGIAAVTAFTALLLGLYLKNNKMPIPVWTRNAGFHVTRYPLHQVFSILSPWRVAISMFLPCFGQTIYFPPLLAQSKVVGLSVSIIGYLCWRMSDASVRVTQARQLLIAMTVGWLLSAVLTATNVLSSSRDTPEYNARTDTRLDVIDKSPWFYFPYPGQFGPSSFNIGIFISFLVPTLISVLDSIADYYACARTVRVVSPPQHAINRGIALEGFFSMVAGFFGASHGTTTSGSSIGVIGITRVGSRRVFQVFGLQLMFLAVIGKFSAFLVTIPYPVLGGTLIIAAGLFTGVVLSNLQYVDINSMRNLGVVGISLALGLLIPDWSKKNPKAFNTGVKTADDLIVMMMTNPNLFGGVVACLLDNTLPGTLKERGMIAWRGGDDDEGGEDKIDATGEEIYDIPFFTQFIQKYRFSKYIPIFPTFQRQTDK